MAELAAAMMISHSHPLVMSGFVELVYIKYCGASYVHPLVKSPARSRSSSQVVLLVFFHRRLQ